MSSDLGLAYYLISLDCPFFPLCTLPKIKFLCKIPECKNCPDYNFKLDKLIK
jgi:hypothetical protein